MASGLAFLELDLIRVVGKTVPVRIYTVVGDERLAASPEFTALAEAHGTMLAAYRALDGRTALRKIEVCRALSAGFGLDGFYDLVARRMAEFERAPPGAGWDTVYIAASKE
jgi:adenylate cyclase